MKRLLGLMMLLCFTKPGDGSVFIPLPLLFFTEFREGINDIPKQIGLYYDVTHYLCIGRVL